MSKQPIAVIDYGMGNLHSVASALEHVCDHNIIISSDPEVIGNAERVVFPGVGAIRDCMAEIKRLQFDTLVPELVANGKAVLGICVGMQALMGHSEENDGVDCINLLPGQVKHFGSKLMEMDGAALNSAMPGGTAPEGTLLKVPHMGWNQVQQVAEHALWHNIDNDSRFYFVHSFYARSDDPEAVVGRCHYGVDFDVALSHNNLFAVQFHPEKSHTAGLQLLKNFSNWQV
jgi:glutamine amidotransferase